MIVKIYKMNGDKRIIKNVRKFELRRNNVVCWYALDNGATERIEEVATIKIVESEE